jgi:hypothetical protein
MQSFLPTAGRLSVTVIHDPSKSYGLRLARHQQSDRSGTKNKHIRDTDDVVIDMIANTHTNGMLKGSPLKEGDILRTINNRKASQFLGCGDSNNSDGCTSYIRGGRFRDGEPVTFVAERPPEKDIHGTKSDGLDKNPESGSAVVRAFCRKSARSNNNDNDNNDNNNNDNDNNDVRSMAIGVEFHRVIVGDEEEEVGRNDEDGNSESESETNSNSHDSSSSSSSPPPNKSSTYSSFLQIDRIDPNGLFAHSVLNQGDIILAINGYSICADENTTVEEANELLGIHHASETATSSSPSKNSTAPGVSVFETVDILALNPRKLLELRRHEDDCSRLTRALWGDRKDRRRWMKKQAKKAGVALGGSAMIGVGAVVHPFGTLLMASGVTVLGTEFETPNRMVRSARDTVEKWAVEELVFERVEEDPRDKEGSASAASTATVSGGWVEEPVATPPHPDASADKEDVAQSTSPPLSPLPRMTNRMKGLGRRYILPLLDRMAGDRRNTTIGASSSFDINDNYNHKPPATNWQQQQQRQQRLHQLQGRDDDCGQGHGSSSLEKDQQSSSISQRVL